MTVINSMEGDEYSDGQEVLFFYGITRFTVVFTKSPHMTLF